MSRTRRHRLDTLGDRIQRSGKLDANEIAELCARVAGWLENRHREGELHGSLNPSAVVLPNGDLQSAALVHPGEVGDDPAFHSPERLAGAKPTKADDLWAVGCLLYFGLTGHPPFSGAKRQDVRARLEQGPAAPLAVFDVCDDDLADITESMLAIAMTHRVTSASTIRDQLAVWLRRKLVRVGPMLEVVHRAPSVRVSLAEMMPELQPAPSPPPPAAKGAVKPVPLDAPSPRPLPRPAGLPRFDAKPAAKPAPSPPVGELADRLPSTADLLSRARAKIRSSMPPPMPGPGELLSRGAGARPKSSIPPPLPLQAVHDSRPKSLPPPLPQSPSTPPPKMPVLPIDLPIVVDVAAPAASARAVAPPPAKPISNRPLPNLFDDLADVPEAPVGPEHLPPLAPELMSGADVAPRSAPPVLAPPPQAQRGFPLWIVVAAVAAVVVGGYAVFRLAAGGKEQPASGSDASSAPSGVANEPSRDAPRESPRPAACASASPGPTGSARATTPPLAVADPEACMESLLAPGAVGEGAKPDFTFMCEETDPRKVASKIRSTVIKSARGAVSDAMREWAVMGWYEYAAFASMRGRCCSGAAKIVLPPTGGLCAPMDDALNEIAEQSRPGATEADQDAALKKYRESLLCIARSGAHGVYGPYDPPSGGQDTAFMKTFARARK